MVIKWNAKIVSF